MRDNYRWYGVTRKFRDGAERIAVLEIDNDSVTLYSDDKQLRKILRAALPTKDDHITYSDFEYMVKQVEDAFERPYYLKQISHSQYNSAVESFELFPLVYTAEFTQ